MGDEKKAFPDGFTWGVATAAHQVEGGNTNNDWWEWEHRDASNCAESSADACDHLNRYRSDIELLASLGFDNYRFSLEWSRIEPSEGEFSKVALDHYRSMCATCLEFDVDPVVTYHHFTTPTWLASQGGWIQPMTVDRFARFAEVVTEHLGDLVARVCTINEPNIVAFLGYGLGMFPPGESNLERFEAVKGIQIEAHQKAVEAIKSVDDSLPVGFTLAMSDYQAVPADDQAAIKQRDDARAWMEDDYLGAARGDDFVGVQTYSRTRVGPEGILGPELGVEPIQYMGYEYWPEALGETIRRAWHMTEQTPLVVTESGLCHTDDHRRIEFVQSALEGVLGCLDDGIDVGGYTYWSLLDNFEWVFGYGPKFGLVAVDRKTLEREPKPSAHWLGEVARANTLLSY